MKKAKLLIAAIMIIACNSLNAQVGISSDGSNPDGSAMLDVKSTEQGFLPPRMTTAERDGISSPVEGLLIYNTDESCLNIYVGLGWRNLCAVVVDGDVINPQTGQIWMDRNLGASQVATSSTDAASYGDLYQWGRFTDGHQIRTSATTTTLSVTDVPGHGDFIIAPSSPSDWRSPQNDNLWQGASGTNNPCPAGYRLPTDTELDCDRASWGANQNSAGAYASPLKLPVAGHRDAPDGTLFNVGSHGAYWSSTVSSTSSRYLFFDSGTAYMSTLSRAYGISLRCLKD